MLLLFFFNDTAPTQIYTLSLHDALPILVAKGTALTIANFEDVLVGSANDHNTIFFGDGRAGKFLEDRKSTRLNSSHVSISYAVFCLKKKTAYHRTRIHLLYWLRETVNYH